MTNEVRYSLLSRAYAKFYPLFVQEQQRPWHHVTGLKLRIRWARLIQRLGAGTCGPESGSISWRFLDAAAMSVPSWLGNQDVLKLCNCRNGQN